MNLSMNNIDIIIQSTTLSSHNSLMSTRYGENESKQPHYGENASKQPITSEINFLFGFSEYNFNS